MTNIPEVGSEWTTYPTHRHVRVVFADDQCVILSYGKSSEFRQIVETHRFYEMHRPAPRKVRYRRWVNLYKNGKTGQGYGSKEEAIKASGYLIDTIAETRLIEWEVEE